MKIIYFFLLLCFLASCANSLDLKPVPLDPLFNDMNSKVWVIDQVITGGKNYAPNQKLDKDIIVFYVSGKCLFQPMKTLGHFVGKQGRYSVNTEDKKITINFEKEIWDFEIAHLSEDTLILDPSKYSDLNYQMVLVPFPEF